MKKFLSLVLVIGLVLSVVTFVGCTGEGSPDDAGVSSSDTLKFGLGVVAKAKDVVNADGETNGSAGFDVTAATVLVDAEGKILSLALDSVELKAAWTADGKLIKTEDLKSKYDKGAEYNMAAAINYGPQNDRNGDGKVLEWYEQADAFIATAKGKTLSEIKAFVAEDGYTAGELATAGCTINVSDFIKATEKAVNSAADSNATAENKLSIALIATNSSSGKDASEEAAGSAQLDTTISAIVKDDAGKVVVAKTDCVTVAAPFDVNGKSTLDTANAIKTKLELGKDYNMAAAINYGPQNDRNGDGKVLEWNEQAAAFDAALVGKTAGEFSGLADDEGYAQGDLSTAGCTISISDMIKAAARAAK